MSAMGWPHVIADSCACSDFYAFYGIHDQETQTSVEVIQTSKVTQPRACSERVVGIVRLLEGAHVGRQAEEADCFEKGVCFGLVLNAEPTLLQERQLRWDSNCRLLEGLHAKQTGIKNPLNLCLAAEATIGMAGVLRRSLCGATAFCKSSGRPSDGIKRCLDGRRQGEVSPGALVTSSCSGLDRAYLTGLAGRIDMAFSGP